MTVPIRAPAIAVSWPGRLVIHWLDAVGYPARHGALSFRSSLYRLASRLHCCCCLREGQKKFCRPLLGTTQPFSNTFAQFIRMYHAQLRETFDLPGLA
jgi:hypothetical protein